jgi:hypothetical protein
MKNINFYIKIDAHTIINDYILADKINYLQHRIIVESCKYRQGLNEYVNLKNSYLENFAGKIQEAKRKAKELGIIHCDGEYITGKKSYGYRITDKFISLPTHRVQCRYKKLNTRIMTIKRKEYENLSKTNRHLWKWLLQIVCNHPTIDFIQKLKEKYSKEQIETFLFQIQEINDKNFYLQKDGFGRVHSNITNFYSPFREELTIKEKRLKEIDISNSQPLFLLISYINYNNYNKSINKTYHHQPPIYESRISNENTLISKEYSVLEDHESVVFELPKDIQLFKELCLSGTLYEFLMKETSFLGDRKEFKEKEWFKFLYGQLFIESKLKEVFKELFPNMNNYIENIKQKNYCQLSWDMQRSESHLVMEVICGRLYKEYPEIPIITIHDSFLTYLEHIDIVRSLILEEFAKIGIIPHLKVKN